MRARTRSTFLFRSVLFPGVLRAGRWSQRAGTARPSLMDIHPLGHVPLFEEQAEYVAPPRSGAVFAAL